MFVCVSARVCVCVCVCVCVWEPLLRGTRQMNVSVCVSLIERVCVFVCVNASVCVSLIERESVWGEGGDLFCEVGVEDDNC